MKFVITGTGRSGTTYCQAVLRVCGVKCSHQQVFTFTGSHLPWVWGDRDGEASFMAVPRLAEVTQREPDTVIVLVTRDRDRVIQSWLERGVFGDDMADTFPDWANTLDRMFPEVLSAATPEDRAGRYYDAWNGLARRYAHEEFDLDSLDLPNLFAAVGQYHNYEAHLAGSISRRINHGAVK